MTQTGQPGSQQLRAEIIRLRRAGLSVDRNLRRDLAATFGVSQRTVSAVSSEVSAVLATATERDGANRRTVAEFDGDKLYHLRRDPTPGGLWLSQAQVAKLAGRSRGEIGHLERGHRKPTILTLVAVADALGVHPSALIKDSHGEAFAALGYGATRLDNADDQAAAGSA